MVEDELEEGDTAGGENKESDEKTADHIISTDKAVKQIAAMESMDWFFTEMRIDYLNYLKDILEMDKAKIPICEE